MNKTLASGREGSHAQAPHVRSYYTRRGGFIPSERGEEAIAGENETLRWPTNLDRAGIEKRLAQVCEAARAQGLAHLVSLLAGAPAMTPAQIGAAVVAALTWMQDKPGSRDVTMQLEMVAMNLKNLK